MMQRLGWMIAAGTLFVLIYAVPAAAAQSPGPATPSPSVAPSTPSTLQPSATSTSAPSPAGTASPVPTAAMTVTPPAASPSPTATGAVPLDVGQPSALLSESDVPRGLQFEPRLSGSLNFLAAQGEMATFMAEEMQGDP